MFLCKSLTTSTCLLSGAGRDIYGSWFRRPRASRPGLEGTGPRRTV